jgi:hypothetical protein
MRRHDADELAGGDHLGFLPEFRKMPLIVGHQVVGAGSIGALQELVIAGVFRDPERARGADELSMILDELEKLLPEAPADFENRAREHVPIFRNDGVGNVKPGWFGDRKQKDGALEVRQVSGQPIRGCWYR